jgi:hypothetical protein
MELKRILLIVTMFGLLFYTATSVTELEAVSAQLRPQKFMATLTGGAEVPVKKTKAMGIFEIELTPGGRVSNYVLNTTNISNVTLVHIHQGERGTNGPIVATLYKSANGSSQANSKFLLKGRVFGKQFEGPLAGKYISDLMRSMSLGQIYVNVHTKQNPQGEIRGQVINVTSHK